MARDLFAEAGFSVSTEGRDLFQESGFTPKKVKDRDALDVIKDIGITGLKGAVSLPEAVVGLADIPSGGAVGKALEDIGYQPKQAKEYLDTLLSPAQQEANAKLREAEGFTDTLATAVQNPSTIATTTLESLPSMLGGAGIARFGLKVAPRIGAVAAGAMGEGAIGAGSAAEQIRGETADGTLTAKQSLSAIGSGIGTGVLGFAGGKLAQKLGVADVDTLLAQGGPRATAQGFVSQVGKAGLSEGAFEELPQSMQEQMWQNFATGKPIMEGVGNAAATGLLAGAAMGGVGGGYNYVANRNQGAASGEQTADSAQPVPNITVVGTPDQAAAEPTATVDSQPVDPLNRLAEIELVSQQRQLTPEEQQEATGLLAQITAQEQDQPTDLNSQTQLASVMQGDNAQPVAPEVEPAQPNPMETPRGNETNQAQQTEAQGSERQQAPEPQPTVIPVAKSVAPTPIEQPQVAQPAPAAVQTDLQNRDRARTASVIQMAGIAKNPDYMRLGPSRTPDSGAPMVFAVDDAPSLIKPETVGNEDVAVMADGQRVPFRYAVVDANAVQPSNFADGSVNPEFSSKVPGTIKALNNGRTAGIRAAHQNGKAEAYVRELAADVQTHGIPAEAIAKVKNPMLVRVYSDTSNTENMAAKSQGQGLGMSPAELAAQDAPMLDSSLIGLYQPLDITHGANRDFVRGFIGKLAGAGQDVAGFLTADGTLSPMGRNRIQAALVQRAYGDADLVETMFDSLDSDIKTIGEVLKLTAGAWANMRDSAEIGAIDPQVDITGNLLQAVNMIRKSRETRQSLYEMTRQADLETGGMPDPLTVDVLRLFYTGSYLTRAKGRERVLDVMGKYIQSALETRGDAGLFGDTVSPLDILGAINDSTEDNTGTGQTLGLPLSGNPSGGDTPGGRAEAQRPIDNEGRGTADQVGNGQSGQDAETAAGQQNGNGNPQGQEGDETAQAVATEPVAQPVPVKLKATDTITDIGEKIGGARKDTATKTGKTGAVKAKDERPAWARRFETSQIVAGNDVGRWVVRDTRTKDRLGQAKQMGGYKNTFATEQEALDAIPLMAVAMKHRTVSTGSPNENGEYQYEIWRDINDRKRVKVVNQVFPSRIAAMEYMAENAQAIMETSTTFGEADLPTPDNTDRTGVERRKGDVEGKDFMETFGFRGVEFGNWNNQIERQQVMNAAYDGLMDLAEVMGIPAKAIGLNGDLALAFGARGQGLSSARAHYERSRAVINLTKMHGAGALAHEWFHALDHYLGRQDGKASSKWQTLPDGTRTFNIKGAENDMASGGFQYANSRVREALRVAYNNVMDTMFSKAETYVEDTQQADKFVARSRDDVATLLDKLRKDLSEQKDPRYKKRNNNPASAEQLAAFDAIAKKIVNGESLDVDLITLPNAKPRGKFGLSGARWTNDLLEELSAINKAVRGRSGFDATNENGVLDGLRRSMQRYSQRLKMLAEAQQGDNKTRKVPTAFAMNAKELDQGRGENYWTTPHEMAARAFQGYVEDKIAALGAQSPFLNYAPENIAILTPWGGKRPYPHGEERKAINAAFDTLVSTLQTKETDNGIALFSRASDIDTDLSRRGGNGIALRDLNAIVTRAKKSLANLPNVQVFAAPADLNQDNQTQKRLYDSIVVSEATADVEGATHEGEIYLFANNIADEFRAEHVLVNHEVGHYGLRAVFGTDIDPIMNNIWMSNASVRKKANALRNKYGLDSNVVATEEVLVEMAPEDLAKVKGWRRLVQYVRNWINDHGFKSLASQLDKLSKAGMSDQEKADLVVADVVNAARSWVRNGRTGRLATVVDTKLSAGTGETVNDAQPNDADPANPDIRFSRSTMGNDEAPDVDPVIASKYEQARAKIKELTNPEKYDEVIYNYQDKFIDLKRLRDKITSTKGTISDLNDAYLGEELYHGRVATRVNEFEEEELKPLLSELRAAGMGIEEFERFLHARHAPEANAAMAEANPTQAMIDEGRKTASDEVKALREQLDKSTKAGSATKDIERSLGNAIDELNRWSGAQAFAGTEDERLSLSGMSDQEAEQVMAGYDAKRRATLDKLADKIDAMNAKTLNLQLQYGLSDKDTIKAWQGKYKHYVPLHRDEAHPDSKSHPIGQGFSVKGQESRRRVGSNAKVTNILAHIAMQRNAAITRGEKNTVAKKLYLLAAQNPDKEFWSLERPKRSHVDPRTGFVVRDVDPNYKNLPNVVMVKIGGVDTAIVFNEHNPTAVRLASAMKNLDMDSVEGLLKLAQKGTRWFASINTQYNPIFGIINLARDVQGAALNLSTTAIAGKQKEVAKELPAAMRAIYRTERGKDATKATKEYQALWREYQEMGGATGYRELFSDAKERQKDIVNKLGADDATGVWAGSKRLFKTAYGYSIGPTVELITDYNTAMENAVRLAAYKVAIDSGISKERAASIGKNLTVNFNRKGAKSGTISALYAFFNASMQGTARMAQTLAGPMGKKIMYGGVLLGAMDTMLAMAVMGGEGDDDDNYAKIPDFVKERSFIIPVSRDQFVSIPMPLGYNVFPNIGRIAVEMAMGKNEKTAGQHLGNLMLILAESFNPIGTSSTLAQTLAPTVIDLPMALIENKDWTGRTIYRENSNPQNPKPGFTMAKDSASFLGKESAKAINALTGGNAYRPGWFSPSPDQIDYVVGQLTGGVGREAMKLEQSLTSMVTGDELPAYKIPLLGRLYGNTLGPTGNAEQFYRNNREINMIENEAKGRAKDGLNAYDFLKTEPLGKLVGMNNAIDNQIQNLRQYRREIVRQDPPDRKERVEQINQQIGDAMRRLNAEVTQIKKEQGKK